MEKKTYSEKLKDPRWQKMRLEVLNRDEWMCQLCQDNESTLNVHHLTYNPFLEPWEYELSNFITLCETCHEDETKIRPGLEQWLLGILKLKGFMVNDLDHLITGFKALKIQYAPEYTSSVIKFALSDGWERLLDLFEKDMQDKIARRENNNV